MYGAIQRDRNPSIGHSSSAAHPELATPSRTLPPSLGRRSPAYFPYVFQVVLHGHIHEAIEGFHKYDDRRAVKIIGAGTFGAPAKEQVTGIPLQYNLLTFDPRTGEMTVNTRKKEKPDGAWSADARWGDKNNPRPWYLFAVPHYQSCGQRSA